MSITVDSFIESYVKALEDHSAAVFAGAGLSIASGLVDWKQLLKSVAKDIGLDVNKESADLVSLAQYHFNERGGRHRLNQALIDEFSNRAKLSSVHKILASLPIRTYWTTNYDTLIETALRDEGKLPDVKITVENLAVTLRYSDAVVYKMHGDVSLPDQAVLTKDDYEAYNTTRQLFSTALQGDLVSKTLLFIGFSFSDPNLGYILSRIRLLLNTSRRGDDHPKAATVRQDDVLSVDRVRLGLPDRQIVQFECLSGHRSSADAGLRDKVGREQFDSELSTRFLPNFD